MDLNQMQNPNMMPPPLNVPSPMAGMPVAPKKKMSPWFFITLVIIVAIGGLIWWYIGQMVVEEPIAPQPQINQEAREDAIISGEIQETDLGNVDAEFEAIDKDINSL